MALPAVAAVFEASAWPSPQARDGKGVDRTEIDRGNTRPLNEVVAHWPTPTSLSFADSHQPGNSYSYNKTMLLAADIWSTPRASDGEKGGPNQSFGAGGIPLASQSANWPTPTALDRPRNDETLAKSAAFRKRNANQNTVPLYLGEVAQKWLTPDVPNGGRTAPADMSPTGKRSDGKKAQVGLENQMKMALSNGLGSAHSSPPARETPTRGVGSHNSTLSAYLRCRATTCSALRAERRALIRMSVKARGKKWAHAKPKPFVRPSFRKSLNPLFVGDLMGWPPGLTSFECSETASSIWRERMRSALSQLTLRPAPPAQLSLWG